MPRKLRRSKTSVEGRLGGGVRGEGERDRELVLFGNSPLATGGSRGAFQLNAQKLAISGSFLSLSISLELEETGIRGRQESVRQPEIRA